MNDEKKISLNLFVFAVLMFMLSGCESDDKMSSMETNKELGAINFTVTGISDYGEGDSVLNRGVESHSSISSDSHPMKVSVPIDSSYEVEATFSPIKPAQSRAVATRTTLTNGIVYRVLAYNSIDGSYVGYADYKIIAGTSSLTSGGIKLEGGYYKFVAYSYQQIDPITDDPSISSLNVNLNEDVLYWEGIINVSGNTTLPIYFKHLFSRLRVVFDATDFPSDFTEASAILAPASGDLYQEGTWMMGSAYIGSLKTTYVPVFNFEEISGSNITSSPQFLLPKSDNQLRLTVNAKFANGSVISEKVLNLGSTVLNSNYSYSCVVKFKRSWVSLIEQEADVYGNSYGGGNCWVLPTPSADKMFLFDATKEGLSGDNIGTTVATLNATRGAKVVWMDNPGLITDATWNEGVISFKVAASHTGNAIIAVTDGIGKTGKILWSWHIWVVPNNAFMKAAVPSETLLDRNLGAMSNNLGSVSSYGLFYQWGRKDPMRREDGNTVLGPQTVGFAIENPDKFITSDNTSPRNWCSDNVDFWGNSTYNAKYNPCPKGWTLVPTSLYSLFSLSNGGGAWNNGYVWNKSSFSPAGFRDYYTGIMNTVGTYGVYWGDEIDGRYIPSVLVFSSANAVMSNSEAAQGSSVRCIRN